MVMAAQLWQSSEHWIVYLERVNLRFMNYISIKLLETFFAPPKSEGRKLCSKWKNMPLLFQICSWHSQFL